MGILDDAIREHLELKRQHGAGDDELKQLEGEAFGPPERPGSKDGQPDALAEAPTEFMAQPDTAEEQATDTASPQELGSGDIKVQKTAERSASRPDPKPGVADLQEAPEPEEKKSEEPEQGESVEEAPAMEHEAIPDPEPESNPVASQGPSTEERQAIADPPTELYDVEGEEFGPESQAPSDEELVEEESGEPRLAPVEPLPSMEEAIDDDAGGSDPADIAVTAADEEAGEEDFFDEKRLSDELDQALDVPLEAEDLKPAEETELEEPGESPSEEESGEPATAGSEDILEDTPDFLEEAPEDDQLWFEQKPPKDFDFDD